MVIQSKTDRSNKYDFLLKIANKMCQPLHEEKRGKKICNIEVAFPYCWRDE